MKSPLSLPPSLPPLRQARSKLFLLLFSSSSSLFIFLSKNTLSPQALIFYPFPRPSSELSINSFIQTHIHQAKHTEISRFVWTFIYTPSVNHSRRSYYYYTPSFSFLRNHCPSCCYYRCNCSSSPSIPPLSVLPLRRHQRHHRCRFSYWWYDPPPWSPSPGSPGSSPSSSSSSLLVLFNVILHPIIEPAHNLVVDGKGQD